MERKTRKVATDFARLIQNADRDVQYNYYILRILRNKKVLAYILVYAVEDFKDYTIDEAVEAIEGEPTIWTVPVEPGMKSSKEIAEAIRGEPTESEISGEGKVYFDIVFTTRAGKRDSVKLYVNIEAQKDFYPGYDLVPRGFSYTARLISEQFEIEGVTKNYDNVKKVYSIWICPNSPRNAQDSIIEYSIQPKILYGNYSKVNRYDIMSVIMICLSEDTIKSENRLVGMLSNLLSTQLDIETKKRILEEDYGFQMSKEVESEVDVMYTYTDIIIEKAEAKGKEEERLNAIRNMLSKGYSEEAILDLDYTVEEIHKAKE